MISIPIRLAAKVGAGLLLAGGGLAYAGSLAVPDDRSQVCSGDSAVQAVCLACRVRCTWADQEMSVPSGVCHYEGVSMAACNIQQVPHSSVPTALVFCRRT